MKMDSPKALDSMIGSKMRMEGENFNERNRMESDSEEKITLGGKNGGLNIWKWGLSGVGAICSFGVAAATICIVIFGNGIHQRNKQQNQRLRFRIYADEKRIKEVVHQAAKLNEAMRGVPLTRAHFTYGGYCDAGL
ncbi:uncharacterized protein LOC130778835 [Actinidia eriantha]|uniref:uncharacterized protein LOC130778835 n=1 Tax=Actinidia eriantha TaxID=165200 RepID=UPI00258E8FB8|nr:uncharacterized protein LOC130778835 [Actinidia eriantha]